MAKRPAPPRPRPRKTDVTAEPVASRAVVPKPAAPGRRAIGWAVALMDRIPTLQRFTIVISIIVLGILIFWYHNKIDFEKSLKSHTVVWQSKLAVYTESEAEFSHILFPPTSDHIGLVVMNIKVINDSDDEMRNIKSIVLRYTIAGKPKEAGPIDMLTHTMYSPQRKTNIQYIRIRHGSVGAVIEDWRNISDVAADTPTLPPKGVLSGCAVFQFDFNTAETLNNVSNPQLVVKEYSDRETVLDLSTNDWSKNHVDELSIENTIECKEKGCQPPPPP
ncbi:hypothetical protein [Methylocella tundrae]|nr:hypothetical protein [Methylocella tundrae]WPP05102.1 hypothetical protein SIN04_04545 [Methylocella tundrae]